MTTTPSPPALFHEGEIALQQRTGAHERVAATAAQFIRDHMPEQHRELFAALPALLVGSVDAEQRPWASMLVGQPGFMHAPDPRHLVVAARPLAGDPLRPALRVGQPLGLLGLQAQTRRRNRLNGTLVAADEAGFTLRVDLSFGNCPQYIHPRTHHWAEPSAAADDAPAVGDAPLDAAALALLAAADTCFIASAVPQAQGFGGARGVDVSHRGGPPGFVRVEQRDGRTRLTLPDYRGNFMFNTLGNIALNPRAGLLFFDPARGDLLQLSGSARILWDEALLPAFPGAQRLLEIGVERSRWHRGGLPLRWSAAG